MSITPVNVALDAGSNAQFCPPISKLKPDPDLVAPTPFKNTLSVLYGVRFKLVTVTLDPDGVPTHASNTVGSRFKGTVLSASPSAIGLVISAFMSSENSPVSGSNVVAA
jgi:hypothetical protein